MSSRLHISRQSSWTLKMSTLTLDEILTCLLAQLIPACSWIPIIDKNNCKKSTHKEYMVVKRRIGCHVNKETYRIFGQVDLWVNCSVPFLFKSPFLP
jgi:hypothetical protein